MTKGNYADLIRLQRHLGHASVSTTAGYLEIADEEQSDWYKKIWEENSE